MGGLIERVLIPALVIFVLLGGLAGTLLGIALVTHSAATLRFMARMNRWVSSQAALRPLEARHEMAPPSPRLRNWLGVCLMAGGALTVVLVLARLHVERTRYMPGVDLRGWLVSGVTLQTLKWCLVVGGAFASVVGALMRFYPQRMAAFEARMDRWYSSPRLLAAEETMHMPLEPHVEANPRMAGGLIAVASLLVAVGMLVLIFAKLRWL
ncbi:MAG TPA: hypothetical protein VFV74_10130 [Burkholderiales bacterium]|nr:hypothetical protein [Burkholderiales bacterium]